MHEIVLGCSDCGAFVRAGNEPAKAGRVRCRRCGALLRRHRPSRLAGPLWLAIAATLFFTVANGLPVFEIGLWFGHRDASIADTATALLGYGAGIGVVGALVALFAVGFPALDLVLALAVLLRLGPGARDRERQPHWPARAWRLALRLRPWCMLDIFLVAAIIAYIRLGQLAEVALGAGGLALAGYVATRYLLDQRLAPGRVWDAIDDRAKYAPPPGAPQVLCLGCGLVLGCAEHHDGRPPRRCPRCHARPLRRRPRSIVATAALGFAGLALYLPANLLPVLSITHLGITTSYTIVGGVRDLA
jgi:paraquat-inducible protein A